MQNKNKTSIQQPLLPAMHSSLRAAVGFTLAASWLGFANPLHAAPVTLQDQNSLAKFHLTQGSGKNQLINWTVDGANSFGQEMDWFRLGNSGDGTRVDSLPLTSERVRNDTNANGPSNELDVTYRGKGFTVSESFDLDGGTAGSGKSQLSESITLCNTSGCNLNLEFVHYDNFTLGGKTTPNAVAFSNRNTFTQTNAFGATAQVVDTTKPDEFEAGYFPTLRQNLNNGSAFKLDDQPTAAGGDVAFASEWNYCLAPCQCTTIRIDEQLNNMSPASVPEPTSLGILTAASVMLLRRQRREAI